MKTKADRIKTVYGGGGHVVILGAGASFASTVRNPEKNGKTLPLMNNLIDVVGLRDIVDNLPSGLKSENFEQLYSNLSESIDHSEFLQEIQKRVYSYFKNLELPDEATIYDYLVLSLRSKDAIVTFNWDPFLYQAWTRNHAITDDLPYIYFLHGNVAIGYSKDSREFGPAGLTLRQSGQYLEPTNLLFPITHKNYNSDQFIADQWNYVRDRLKSKSTKLVTVFGYGAPASDIEAMKLLNDAYGNPDDRNMEQFEIIDIRPREEVTDLWDGFIHSHHYDYSNIYFGSLLAQNPRRTSEAYFQQYMAETEDEFFAESNPVPNDLHSLQELWDWHKPLIEAEVEWRNRNEE